MHRPNLESRYRLVDVVCWTFRFVEVDKSSRQWSYSGFVWQPYWFLSTFQSHMFYPIAQTYSRQSKPNYTPQFHRGPCIRQFLCTGCCIESCPNFVGYSCDCMYPCTACTVCPFQFAIELFGTKDRGPLLDAQIDLRSRILCKVPRIRHPKLCTNQATCVDTSNSTFHRPQHVS